MATSTTVRIYFEKSRFQVLQEEVTAGEGTFTITLDAEGAPDSLGAALGSTGPFTLLSATLPAGSKELAFTLRSAGKTFTGPNGEFVYPEIAKLSYDPASPSAVKDGLTKVSGCLIGQQVLQPHLIAIVTYAPKCPPMH